MNYINKKNNEITILKYHLIAIVPLMLYGFYKNGISLYLSNSVSFFESLMPLFYTLGFAFIIILIKKLLKKDFCVNDFYYFVCLLFLPITYNYILVFTLFAVFYFFSLTKIKLPFNIIFLLILYLALGNNLTFLNIVETTKEFKYTYFDLFIGKGSSYLMTSSILFGFVSFIYLYLKPYYKSLIVLSFMVFYCLLTIAVGYFLNIDFSNLIGIFSTMIFLGSAFTYTPVTNLRMCLYSLVVALLCVILNYFIDYYMAIIISILIVQTFYSLKVNYTNVLRKK